LAERATIGGREKLNADPADLNYNPADEGRRASKSVDFSSAGLLFQSAAPALNSFENGVMARVGEEDPEPKRNAPRSGLLLGALRSLRDYLR
jgi:hypothetical protein